MTVLLLGGTAEARALADLLVEEDIPAVISLAGATRSPQSQALPTRIGGFGGATEFRDYLAKAGITTVLDVTHPFATDISNRTARICAQTGVRYCQLLRPPWVAAEQDQWVHVARARDAAAHIAPDEVVFLATGRQSFEEFANLTPREVYCRQIDPPDRPFPFAKGAYILGQPPFEVDDEVALFQKLKIDWLVVKNAGGTASFSKLIAARELGLRVIMIDRPKQPDAPQVETVNAAMAWVRSG